MAASARAQNWAIGGKKVGDFDLSLFASDARSDGYIYHTDYNTQTFDFLGTWSPTPTDRVVLKLMQNDWLQRHGRAREPSPNICSIPFSRATAAPYQTHSERAVLRRGRRRALAGQRHRWKRRPDAKSRRRSACTDTIARDVVGLRYEHDFDSLTTWRTQAMYD